MLWGRFASAVIGWRGRRVVGTLALLAGVAVFWEFAISEYVEATHLESRGIRAEATVLKVEHNKCSIGWVCAEHTDLTVEFTDDHGRTLRKIYITAINTETMRRGQRVDIIYDPADPGEIRDVKRDDRDGTVVMMGIDGFLMLGLAMMTLRRAWLGPKSQYARKSPALATPVVPVVPVVPTEPAPVSFVAFVPAVSPAPAAYGVPVPGPRQRTAAGSIVLGVVFALLPWMTLGMGTWIAFLLAAAMARSARTGQRIALAAAGVGFLTLTILAIMIANIRPDPVNDAMFGALMSLTLLVGGVVSFGLAPWLVTSRRAPDRR